MLTSHIRSLRIGLAGSLLVLILAGMMVRPASTWAAGQAAAGALQQDYVIGPEDLIDIRVFGEPELGGKFRVTAQGNIRLPFIGQIKAAGYTESQLVEIVREKLKAQLKDPQVSVLAEDRRNQRVTLLGFVRSPNNYELTAGTRLITLVAMAGGLLENAGETAIIIRATSMHEDNTDGAEPEHVSMGVELVNLRKMMAGVSSSNPPIFPGDVVTIPQAERIIVSGNVNNPGAFELRGNMTLTQAIALAGGTKQATNKRRILVVRRDPDNDRMSEVVADLGLMEKDPREDLQLRAGDIVSVQASAMKSFSISLLNALAMQSALLPLYLIRR